MPLYSARTHTLNELALTYSIVSAYNNDKNRPTSAHDSGQVIASKEEENK